MSIETVTHIDLREPLDHIGDLEERAVKLPQEPHEFKQYLRSIYLGADSPFEELHGGHRNLILQEKGTPNIQIIWRSHETRWPIIIRAVLTEHIVSTVYDTPGRSLQNPQFPLEINEHKHVVTKLRYVPGEHRYPWNEDEIQSSAFLLKKLHTALRHVTFDPKEMQVVQDGEHQWVHGDFGRANALFRANTSLAESVIDFENLQFSSREQDIARTVSLLLVDTKLQKTPLETYTPTHSSTELDREFDRRMEALIDTYPIDAPILYDEVISYAQAYLRVEDYGSLNPVAYLALDFMNRKFSHE